MNRVLVLYHCPCPDGAFAALAARLHFGSSATYMPHSTTVPIDLAELPKSFQTLYLLDYCGPHGFIERACQHFEQVYLIDHHKTALEELSDTIPNFKYSVQMEHSGCILALEWFSTPLCARLDRVFDYIEDNDLWLHKLPQSKEFTAGLQSLNLPYDNPAIFDFLLTLDADTLISFGKAEIAKRATYIASVLPLSTILPCGSRLLIVQNAQYVSDLGHVLAESSMSNIGIVATPLGNVYRLSLRSINGVDTTPIAVRYGGGGHAAASGCIVSIFEMESIRKNGILN